VARPLTPGTLATFAAESLRVPARVWRATFAEFLESDFSHELTKIDAPTLILWGDRDAICPYSDQVRLRGSIQESRLIVYPGGGHALHWEDPLVFAADVVAFTSEVSASTLKVAVEV
jgi:pimeloyl-ACP methyl ester carboxylesterase